ncbi:hypothetical protein BC938DRAFT_476136, partial [Jimgerdemannia flammicorona]
YIESILPNTARKLDSFLIQVSYEFEVRPGVIPFLFEEIEAHKTEHGIDDWGLSQTSLEEVFLRIIGGELRWKVVLIYVGEILVAWD